MKRLLFVTSVVLIACSQPEPVFTDEMSVRTALNEVTNARFTARMVNEVEASGSRWERVVNMDWQAQHVAGDSAYGMAWSFVDAFTDEGETSQNWGHLWQHTLTTIGSDSTLSRDAVDPAHHRNGTGIPNYYTSMTLPTMLHDSTWWAEQVSDSSVLVVWEHVLPTPNTPEQFIVTSTDIQNPEDEDFHPDTRATTQWVFEAPLGLPVRHASSWYRGDMAYGSDMTIEWTWEAVNDAGVEDAIAGWNVPEWAVEPEPAAPEVAGGGGDEDWYETTLASLPALNAAAPDLEGRWLSGGEGALSDLNGELVYLDFWYIGCGPCMRALPHLADMQERFGPQGFRVLGVNHHQDSATVKRYLDRRALEIPQLLLDSLPEAYPVQAYPTWFLVGRDGSVIARDMGYGEDTGAFLDSLVGANL